MEGVPNEAGASLKEGIPIGGHLNVDKIRENAPSGAIAPMMLPPKPADIEPSRKRLVNQLLLSTFVSPQERIHPLTGMVAHDPEGALEIIHCWSPFNQANSPVAHMLDLYPNYFRVLMAARVEQHTIPLLVYMDKEAFQLVAEDGMLIRNHDFHRSAELVCVDF